MKTLVFCGLAVLAACGSAGSAPAAAIRPAAPALAGEWDSKDSFGGQPWHFQARFKTDGTYDGIGNGKLIISGQYRVSGDTVFFRDAVCGAGYEGLYRLTYVNDSVRFSLISDSCRQRIAGSDQVALGRVHQP